MLSLVSIWGWSWTERGNRQQPDKDYLVQTISKQFKVAHHLQHEVACRRHDDSCWQGVGPSNYQGAKIITPKSMSSLLEVQDDIRIELAP